MISFTGTSLQVQPDPTLQITSLCFFQQHSRLPITQPGPFYSIVFQLKHPPETYMCTTAMCIAHYLHYHHVPPCYRPTGLNYYYSYCAAAHYDPVTSQPLAPCDSVSTSSPGGDLNDPCTMSQCLIDPGCRSGACRLADLNGQWKCCMCGRRENFDYQCFNARSADVRMYCTHQVCENCTADET